MHPIRPALLATALALLLAWPTLGADTFTPQPTPAALKAAVTDAELWGRKLLEIYGTPPPDSGLLEKAVQTAHDALKTGCTGRYTLLVPDDRIEDGILVYEIAELKPGVINIGGQSKILVSPDGGTALWVKRSAKSCLTLSAPEDLPAGGTPEAAFVTHLLSPTPTEFHVLASLNASLPLLVATSAGAWSVDKGIIRYLGPLTDTWPQ